MAGRPPKPLELLKGHVTNDEKETRISGEAALTGGLEFKPSLSVQNKPAALEYFNRLTEVFNDLSMSDASYENVLNRYCILLAEHDEAEQARMRLIQLLDELYTKKADMDFLDFITKARDLHEMIMAQDRALAKKRDQLLSIEKENVMTVQGKLRAVPKKPEKKGKTGIEAYRQRRDG